MDARAKAEEAWLAKRVVGVHDEIIVASEPYRTAPLCGSESTGERFIDAMAGWPAKAESVDTLISAVATAPPPPETWSTLARAQQGMLRELAAAIINHEYGAHRPLSTCPPEEPIDRAHVTLALRPCARLMLIFEVEPKQVEALSLRATMMRRPTFALHLAGTDSAPYLMIADRNEEGTGQALSPRARLLDTGIIPVQRCARVLPLMVAQGRCDLFIVAEGKGGKLARLLYTVADTTIIEPATRAWWKIRRDATCRNRPHRRG